MAQDLREIVAAMRISNDLERVGDLAKNIAKRVIAIDGNFSPKRFALGVEHMAELAMQQLKSVLDAYAERDAERSRGRPRAMTMKSMPSTRRFSASF